MFFLLRFFDTTDFSLFNKRRAFLPRACVISLVSHARHGIDIDACPLGIEIGHVEGRIGARTMPETALVSFRKKGRKKNVGLDFLIDDVFQEPSLALQVDVGITYRTTTELLAVDVARGTRSEFRKGPLVSLGRQGVRCVPLFFHSSNKKGKKNEKRKKKVRIESFTFGAETRLATLEKEGKTLFSTFLFRHVLGLTGRAALGPG